MVWFPMSSDTARAQVVRRERVARVRMCVCVCPVGVFLLHMLIQPAFK